MNRKRGTENPAQAWLLGSGLALLILTLGAALVFKPWASEIPQVRAANVAPGSTGPTLPTGAATTSISQTSPLPITVLPTPIPSLSPGELAAYGPAPGPMREGDAIEILEQHWGNRLPEILEQNRVDPVWLASYPMSALPAWEEVSEDVLDRALRYLDTLRASREYLLLTGENGLVDLFSHSLRVETADAFVTDFESVSEAAAKVEKSLTADWNRRWDGVEVVIRARWKAGDVECHPILSCLDQVPQEALYAHSGSARGWTYRIVLLPEEEPALAQSLAEFERARRDAYYSLTANLVHR
jgi:hypothetical protein